MSANRKDLPYSVPESPNGSSFEYLPSPTHMKSTRLPIQKKSSSAYR